MTNCTTRAAAATLTAAAVIVVAGCQGGATSASVDNSRAAQLGVSAIHASPAPAGTPVGIVQQACTSTMLPVRDLAGTTPVYTAGGVPMCQWTDVTGLNVVLALEADPHGSVPSTTGWTTTSINGHDAADHTGTQHPGCTLLVAVGAVGAGTIQVNTYRHDPDCATARQVATAIIPR